VLELFTSMNLRESGYALTSGYSIGLPPMAGPCNKGHENWAWGDGWFVKRTTTKCSREKGGAREFARRVSSARSPPEKPEDLRRQAPTGKCGIDLHRYCSILMFCLLMIEAERSCSLRMKRCHLIGALLDNGGVHAQRR